MSKASGYFPRAGTSPKIKLHHGSSPPSFLSTFPGGAKRYLEWGEGSKYALHVHGINMKKNIHFKNEKFSEACPRLISVCTTTSNKSFF